MPEYLAPGVYVEEVSFRAKTIEGVPTSTTGFAGMTRWGPIRHDYAPTEPGPRGNGPRLVTSFTEFERVYGGLEPLQLAGGTERVAYLAHAARAFFLNGGKRLYVSRVASNAVAASLSFAVGTAGTALWRARWPGMMGNVYVQCSLVRSRNVAFLRDFGTGPVLQANRARRGALVEIFQPGDPVATGTASLNANFLYGVRLDANGRQIFVDDAGADAGVLNTGSIVHLIELSVQVVVDAERTDFYGELGFHPDQPRFVGRVLERDNPADEDAAVWLRWNADVLGTGENDRLRAAIQLALGITSIPDGRLSNGTDGQEITGAQLLGAKAHPDFPELTATGLEALGEVDDIAIVAAPDASTLGTATVGDPQVITATGNLIAHADEMRYRIAVVDGPPNASINQIRAFRGNFDSKHAALYHPHIWILDPLARPAQGVPPQRVLLPPSGFVCGIYARSDIERGVHKAPANEIVRGLTRLEININKPRQDVLTPEEINALRFFEGRGSRVWGARTLSSDPEWKYVNVRRLFIYLENSIDRATQWAVFEPNNERLWANIRRAVEDFLLVQWKNGALMGEKPERAFFVRCDRTTMTQNDLDNGRLICLIGVAPVYPAEFVIFRIGQWTGDAVTNPTS